MTETVKWAWRTIYPGSGFHDEFDSRQEAIEDARLCGYDRVLVGQVVDLVPVDHVPLDVDMILEAMDESAGIDCDDAIFEVDDVGRQVFEAVIRAWAREHVKTNVPRVMRAEEEVEP